MRIFLALLFFATIASADREGGPYIGIGYGDSKYKSDGLYSEIKDEKTKLEFFYGGAYINKYLSVELGYAKTSGKAYVIDDELSLEYTMYNVSTLLHYAFFNDNWDFYAKFGAGKVKSFGIDGFTFLYGAGTSLRFSELFSLKLAYDMYEFGYDETNNGSSDYKQRIYYPYIAVEFQF